MGHQQSFGVPTASPGRFLLDSARPPPGGHLHERASARERCGLQHFHACMGNESRSLRSLSADRTPVGGYTNVLPIQFENGYIVRFAEARRTPDNDLQHSLEFGRRSADDLKNFRCRPLLLQAPHHARGSAARPASAGWHRRRCDAPRSSAHWGVLSLSCASPVFHGIAVCCARAGSGHAAAAKPRIPGNPRRFMTGVGPGADIVSARTNALEGARTGFRGLLQQDI